MVPPNHPLVSYREKGNFAHPSTSSGAMCRNFFLCGMGLLMAVRKNQPLVLRHFLA